MVLFVQELNILRAIEQITQIHTSLEACGIVIMPTDICCEMGFYIKL